MSIGHPIPELWLFQNLTLKINGQGHGWGHSSKSQCGSSILSTHIPFVPCQSALPFLGYSIYKIWPWKSRVKVMDEVTVERHNVGLTSYRLTSIDSQPFRSMSIGPTVPGIQHFLNLTLQIKGKFHGWSHNLKSQCGSCILSTHIPFVPCQSGIPFQSYDSVQSHNVGLAYYPLTSISFHVNRPSHSWDTAFSKFDHENQESMSNDPDVAQLQV